MIEGEEIDPKLRKLFPDLSDEQLRAAEQHFQQYIEAVLRVAEEIEKDPEKRTRFDQLLKKKRSDRSDPQAS